ncbi:MAG: CDP-diacylglycerol--serine O-phosphatidyltransferase [Burkholderiales bacterium]|jgi:CDP-diacylglycerol--serine O-phosphatidyltransferase|nr:CDP-diacylglycerol--serine O-phosphatidyltransferase [Burkholderiales bacterium]
MSLYEKDHKERVLRKNAARRRGIYLLPNLFTTAALFAGFYSIVQGMNGHFGRAAGAIFVAAILDSLDGRVARLTKTQSAFGAEYDSLSDMVSFGVAPALLIYVWALQGLGKLGWIAAFIYVAGAAARLARFNTMLEVADKRWFSGIPSPAAAALVASFVWVFHDNAVTGREVLWLACVVTLFAGIVMPSNLRYYSFKTVNLKKSVPFVTVLVLVLAFALLASQPPLVLFCCSVLYALSGFATTGWVLWRERRRNDAPPVER